MRHGLALVLAIGGCLSAGCFSTQPTRTASRYGGTAPFQGPTGDDVVQLLIALIEKPVGDPALNQDIWQLADEQGIDLEHKVALHANGFRMGQFGSSPPASLLDLIHSERSCVNPRCINMRASNPTPVLLGPEQSRCCFQLLRSGDTIPIELERAQCQLQVTPLLNRDGTTRLKFVPCIKHGQPTRITEPVQEPGGTLGWHYEVRQPMAEYQHLSWQQTVSDKDYAIVGTWLDRQGTLGQCCFIETEPPAPIQRLLVLRVMRAGLDSQPPEDLVSKSSIAAQASQTVRGTPPSP